jgi:hypothetical protein
MFRSLIAGLQDYTVDERGDVGSWVRLSCIQGLGEFIRLLTGRARSSEKLQVWIPPADYHLAVAGLLKQGVERLDNVRQQAGEEVVALLGLDPPAVQGAEAWTPANAQKLRALFTG